MKNRTVALFGILPIIATTLLSCGSGETEFQLIESIESQDGALVFEYAPSKLSFGSAEFRVRAVAGDVSSILYENKISDDGHAVTLKNVRPNTSKPGFLWLCLNGVEQNDVTVRIELATGIVSENERRCTDE